VPLVIASLLASVVLLVLELRLLLPLSPSFLWLQLSFTPRAFGQVVHLWTPEQLAAYRAHLPLDVALLGCYAAFGYFCATRTTWLAPHGRAARWLLPLAALFDLGENALHAWLTDVPRLGVTLPYLLAGTSSTLKFGFTGAFFALWAAAVVRRVVASPP
jgi:hypothetical protein